MAMAKNWANSELRTKDQVNCAKSAVAKLSHPASIGWVALSSRVFIHIAVPKFVHSCAKSSTSEWNIRMELHIHFQFKIGIVQKANLYDCTNPKNIWMNIQIYLYQRFWHEQISKYICIKIFIRTNIRMYSNPEYSYEWISEYIFYAMHIAANDDRGTSSERGIKVYNGS